MRRPPLMMAMRSSMVSRCHRSLLLLVFSGLLVSSSSLTSVASTTRIAVQDAIAGYDELTFIDASWYHKGDRDGRDEYLRGPRIPNAIYFDLNTNNCGRSGITSSSSCVATTTKDEANNKNHNRPQQQPTADQFASMMDRSGITNDSNIVVYGQAGAFFVPRVWFTIRHLMGHTSCRILDGTLEDWAMAGGKMEYSTIIVKEQDMDTISTTTKASSSSSSSYRPNYQPDFVLIGLTEMKRFVIDRQGYILDARGSSFRRDGHMPGAVHVPYSSLHDPKTGRLLPADQIASILPVPIIRLLLDDDQDHDDAATNDNDIDDIVVTCGSGVSACTLFLALQEVGQQLSHPERRRRRPRLRVRVYDGSWSEWKMYNDLPKVSPPIDGGGANK